MIRQNDILSVSPRYSRAFFIILAMFTLFFSCASLPDFKEESPSIYFKAAEIASFQRQRNKAIKIYQAIQLHFADSFTTLLEAEFSIAQIYFSWSGHDKEALRYYNNILAFHTRPEIGTDIFPLSYLTLAQKNIATIKKRKTFRFFPPKTRGVHSVEEEIPEQEAESE